MSIFAQVGKVHPSDEARQLEGQAALLGRQVVPETAAYTRVSAEDSVVRVVDFTAGSR